MLHAGEQISNDSDRGRLIVVHFDEVALKGGRRRYFVNKLMENIRRACETAPPKKVRSLYDRILVGPVADQHFVSTIDAVSVLPGVAWYAEVTRVPASVDCLPVLAEEFSAARGHRTFAVRARRSKKDFPLNSSEINRDLGRMIQQRTGWSVDLENPEMSLYVDVTPQGILACSEKCKGPGGLPVGSTGKLICLLSGGIDSPVAAYKMMCRGCRVVFVHFHNSGPQAHGVRRKLIQIVEQLSRYQADSRLYLVPFAQAQSDLVAAVPPRRRMVAYRRAMLRMAVPILEAEKALGLVVGDSVGQVASQTLENLHATYTATEHPVLTPLIGEGKKAIMQQARRIGTYAASILPYDDCCQLMVAKSPDTSCSREQLEAYERELPMDDYRQQVLENAEVIDVGQSAPTEKVSTSSDEG